MLGNPFLKTMEPGLEDGRFGEIPYRSHKKKPSLATSLLYLFYERPFGIIDISGLVTVVDIIIPCFDRSINFLNI